MRYKGSPADGEFAYWPDPSRGSLYKSAQFPLDRHLEPQARHLAEHNLLYSTAGEAINHARRMLAGAEVVRLSPEGKVTSVDLTGILTDDAEVQGVGYWQVPEPAEVSPSRMRLAPLIEKGKRLLKRLEVDPEPASVAHVITALRDDLSFAKKATTPAQRSVAANKLAEWADYMQ